MGNIYIGSVGSGEEVVRAIASSGIIGNICVVPCGELSSKNCSSENISPEKLKQLTPKLSIGVQLPETRKERRKRERKKS